MKNVLKWSLAMTMMASALAASRWALTSRKVRGVSCGPSFGYCDGIMGRMGDADGGNKFSHSKLRG